MVPIKQEQENTVLFVEPERVGLARRTHRSVNRTMFIIFGILVAIILVCGIWLSFSGRTSFWGIIAIAAVFVAFPFIVAATNRKLERDAERFVVADGTTQIIVGKHALTIADTVIPYEYITFVYGTAQGEYYSSGGIRGEVMAKRLDLTENRPTIGRGVGSMVGTAQRRKLYRDGAKSAVSLAIGVNGKSTLNAPDGLINPLRTLPRKGDDPGRIDMPFGAYQSNAELEALLGAIALANNQAFPVGIVSGVLD